MSTNRTQADIRSESDSDPIPDPTNERTHGRTKRSDADDSCLKAERAPVYREVGSSRIDSGSPAASRSEEFTTPGDVIHAGHLWPTGERHPVIRKGEREPIPPHVRAAVWYRDAGRCKPCGEHQSDDAMLHLDHIEPWSAGGPDTTDNLRLLCERHNVERSNFIDYAQRVRPATWWCLNCYDRDGFGWDYVDGFPVCPTHSRGFKVSYCRVMRRYEQAQMATLELPTWHERTPILTASVIAYCAHCDAPGLTDRPL